VKKLKHLLIATILLAGLGVASDLGHPLEAQASGWCTFNYELIATSKVKLSNISCGGGRSVRPWIKYYQNDNNVRVSIKYGDFKTSGTSEVSRPPGSFYHSHGFSYTG